MKAFLFLGILMCCLFGASLKSHAQSGADTTRMDSTQMHQYRQVEITTLNNDIIRGYVIHQVSQTFIIKTYGGLRVEIPFDQVKEMRSIIGPEDQGGGRVIQPQGGEWFADPHYHRYYVMGSNFPLEAGTGHIKNSYIFVNTVRVGITDHLSIGGGFEFISSLLLSPILMISPKYTFQISPIAHAGISATYINSPTDVLFTFDGVGLVQASLTLGSHEKHITGGIGWGYWDNALSQVPSFNISGSVRLTNRLGFVTDNWLIPLGTDQYLPLISYGVRIMGRKVAGDLAFVNSPLLSQYITVGVPYVSVAFILD